MKNYIFILVALLILTTPLFQLKSQTTDQVQPITLSPTLNVATPTEITTTSDQLPIPKVDLKPGVRHKEVKALQKILKSMGYLPENLQLTEVFGPKTKAALIRFQKSQGLPATGVFDQETRLALENYFNQRLMLKRAAEVGKPVTDSVKINEFFSNLTSRLDRNVSTTCMKLAIEKRENALIAAWETYAAKMKSAYETRKNELVAAWAISDAGQRQTAIKSAWSKFYETVKIARAEWNQLKRNAWTQFAQEAKTCKASIVETQEVDEVKTTE